VQNPVTVNPITDTFPASTTDSRTYSNVMVIDFTKGGFKSGESARVKVELIITDPKIGEFRSLTINIYNANTSTLVATLTKDTPVAYFTETVPTPLGKYLYNVEVVFQTGATEITTTLKLGAYIAYVS
jgi:hypothetical protein